MRVFIIDKDYSAAVTSQGEMDQRNSVHDLMVNRNQEIITTCPQVATRILSCTLRNGSLIIENKVYLQRISIVIETCRAVLSPVFMFSNTTMVEADNLRQPKTIPLGQLSITFDLDVCINQTSNFTVIGTSVSQSHYWRVILLLVMLRRSKKPAICDTNLWKNHSVLGFL